MGAREVATRIADSASRHAGEDIRPPERPGLGRLVHSGNDTELAIWSFGKAALMWELALATPAAIVDHPTNDRRNPADDRRLFSQIFSTGSARG